MKLIKILASYILIAILTMGFLMAVIGLIGLLWFVACSILAFTFEWSVPVTIVGVLFLCIAMSNSD